MMEEKSLYLRERDMEDESHGNGNGRNCPTTTTTTTTQESSEGRGGGGGSGINNDSCLKNIKSEDHNISCGGASTILPHVTSNATATAAAATAATTATTTVGHHHHHTSNKEQDRFLPIANVGRIMKKVIPVNGKISKDAKETVQECVSEFISFVTGEASDKCQREKRKTINGDDIIWAITTLGFEEYVVPLKSYLNKYREIEGEKLNLPKQQRIEPRLPQQQQQQQQQMSQPHHLHQHQLLHHQDGEVVQQNIHQSYNNNNVYSSSMNLVSQPPSFVATEPAFSIAFSPPHSIPKPLQPQDELDSLRHWQEENIGKYIG